MVENPMIALAEDRCKFYVDELNTQKYGHCLIFALGVENVEKAVSRDGKPITREQIRWFNDNCPNYPRLEDVGKFTLISGCGFSFEVVTDG